MPVNLDLGNEWLLDASSLRQPELRLLAAVLGRPMIRGSGWVVIPKPGRDRASRRAPAWQPAAPRTAKR